MNLENFSNYLKKAIKQAERENFFFIIIENSFEKSFIRRIPRAPSNICIKNYVCSFYRSQLRNIFWLQYPLWLWENFFTRLSLKNPQKRRPSVAQIKLFSNIFMVHFTAIKPWNYFFPSENTQTGFFKQTIAVLKGWLSQIKSLIFFFALIVCRCYIFSPC